MANPNTTKTPTTSGIPLTKKLLSWFLIIFLNLTFTTYYSINTIFLHSSLTFNNSFLQTLTFQNKLLFSTLLSLLVSFLIKKALDKNPEYWIAIKNNLRVQFYSLGANIMLHYIIDFVMMVYLQISKTIGLEEDIVRLITGIAMTLTSFLAVFYVEDVTEGLCIFTEGLNANVKYLIRLERYLQGCGCAAVSTLFLGGLFVKQGYRHERIRKERLNRTAKEE